MSEQNGMKIFVFLKFLIVKDFGEKKSDCELSFPFSSLNDTGSSKCHSLNLYYRRYSLSDALACF